MTEEELEIAKAACCVGTIWDEYEGKENFDYMVGLRVKHLIELVQNYYQPSLPSNLDVAAEKKARDIFESLEKHDIGEEKNRVLLGLLELGALALTFSHFGAEWMAGQGITVEGDIEGNWRNQEDAPYEIYVTSDCLPKDTEFKFGDKVVVQIRKK